MIIRTMQWFISEWSFIKEISAPQFVQYVLYKMLNLICTYWKPKTVSVSQWYYMNNLDTFVFHKSIPIQDN